MPSTSKQSRDQAPINYWTPTIDHIPITSISHLHTLLNSEYPGLARNPNYPTWLHDAETHLTLIHHLKDQTHLQRGDRKSLGEELGITRQKFTAWAQEGRKPRFYYELERMISKTQANKKISQLHNENNDLRSSEDVITRLQTYYLTPLHEQSKQHQKRLHQCTLYFQALDLLKDGGAYLDIARHLGIHHSQIMHWLDGSRPDYLELTRHIPKRKLKSNWKWLPLNLERAFVPTHLITVPNQITHYTEINNVLDQLTPLDNDAMHKWQTRFGPPNPEDAFYYLLGLIVSDFDKQKSRISSTELILNLSKNYDWSEQLGEAACYYLGQLGIHAKKVKDRDSSAGPEMCHSWRSQKSPFITWILLSALGLEPNQRTTFHPIRANWLLDTPQYLRVAFIQGLNDGDGWVSVKDQRIGNSCQPNIDFVITLFRTFSIPASSDKRNVRIHSQEGVIKAAKLPYFRYATERQRNASKLAEMMQVRQQQEPGINSEMISNLILSLRNEGKSFGEIAEYIFDELGLSFDRYSIRYRLKKLKGVD